MLIMAKQKKVVANKSKETKPGLAFVGCLMLGIGTGLYYGRPDVGVLIGLGVGFIAMAILTKKK